MACNTDSSCLPRTFSWLDQAQRCPSLNQIRDQKGCQTCWAVSSAAVISDRYCLRTNQTRIFSAKEIAACAEKGSSCDEGGDPKVAMNYYTTRGLVTGGDPKVPGQQRGCMPYPNERHPQLKCETTCEVPYRASYKIDKHKGVSWYTLTNKDVNDIKHDLMRYGPLVICLDMYDDFLGYTGGIYKRNRKKAVNRGGHAVRLLGWGDENGVPFWLCANSWGTNWGEKGFFRIISGKNFCNIEEYLIGVLTHQR